VTQLLEKAKGPGYDDLHYRLDDMTYTLTQAFRAGKPLRWPVVPRARVHQVWSDFVRDGYVRDEQALDAIFTSMRDSVVCLELGTIVAQHTGCSPESVLEDLLDASQYEPFCEWLVDFEGEGRLSDYGLAPLQDAIALAFEAKTPTLRLKYLDRALHVAHARGDLSRLLIEGGRSAVLALADMPEELSELCEG
jgi:hypothetical protein